MEENSEKNDKLPLSGLALDGQRVRTIREDKKLTQLYVANVVGVTTDTISRWENNRYPSIKRDNAEKLAQALEVSLDQILRSEESDQLPAPPAPRHSRSYRLLLLLTGVVFMVLILRAVAPSVNAERWLPACTPPGETIPVQLKINRKEGSGQGFIIHERLPAGWRLKAASPPTAPAESAGGELKWLVPAGSGPVTISYTLLAPADGVMQSSASFSGSIVVHRGGIGQTREIGGQRSITLAPYHWADRNGDSRIDDNEIMPAYYLTEEMKGLDLDWKTIESIWNAGGYRWDGVARRFQVVN